MTHTTTRSLFGLGCLLAGWGLLVAAPERADLSEYRTAEKAIAAPVKPPAAGAAGQAGYFGASVGRDGQGRVVVEEVQPGSPAAVAGLKKGDVVTRVADHAVRTPEAFREWLQASGPGEAVKLALVRGGQAAEATATL